MSRVRKGKKQKKLLAAAPRQPVKPPSRPPPKRKAPASQKGAKNSDASRDTAQKPSFTSLAVRSKPSKAPPSASPFAGEWSHVQQHIHESNKGDDESVAGTADTASLASLEQHERDAEIAAHFSTRESVFPSQELLRDTTEWDVGTLYNGEMHYGRRAMKAEHLIEIEEKMHPLRASEIIDSGRQPRDHSGNLKEPMDWDIRLLINLKEIVEICQDTAKINCLLAKYVRLRMNRRDQRHRRVGHGAAMDVLRKWQETQVHEREEVE